MGDLDFELEIRSEGGRDYRVAVLRSPAGEAHTTMRFPFDELALNVRLQAIEIALLRSGGSRRRLASPEENTVLEFGRDLFDALVSGDVRSRFDVSRTEALRQGKPLRVKLRFDTPALAALPWEFLYDPRKGEYLVLSTNTPLVRYIELPEVIEPLSVTTPLRILGMVASPDDLPVLDVDRERLRINEATKDLQTRGLVQIHWLEDATWRDLQQALRREKWHIFHFVGHGGFDPNTDEGLIALVDEGGGTFRLAATELARLLGDHQPLRLAVLNACEGARGSNHDLFASTAAAVVRRGTPAVVAMQYEITDRAAIEFSRSFYEAIADGMPVDVALAEARKSVSVAINNTLEWGTPVLFMRSEDGVLFKIRRPKEAPGPVPASSPFGPAVTATLGVVGGVAMPTPPAIGGSVEPKEPTVGPALKPVGPAQSVAPGVEPVASDERPTEPALKTGATAGPSTELAASAEPFVAPAAAPLVVAPTELDFGTLLVGAESPSRIIEIRSGKPTRMRADRADILLTGVEGRVVVRVDTSRAGALTGIVTVGDETTMRSVRVVARIDQSPVASLVKPIAVVAAPPPAAPPIGHGVAVPGTVARPPRRTRFWVAAGAIVIVAAALFLIRALIPSGGTAEVPMVVDLSLADATSQLESACTPSPCFDVSVTWIPAEPGGPAPGVVVDQTPRSGQFAKGSTILLRVVEETQTGTITVPNVVKLTLKDSLVELDKACAEPPCFKIVEDLSLDSGVEPDRVVAQTPAGGSRVDKGSQVTLTVSQAPPDSDKSPLNVPNLVGLPVEQAKGELDKACTRPPCFVIDEQPNFDAGLEPGLVVAQTPAAGSSVAKGSTITLYVSQTPPEAPAPQLTSVDTGVDAGFESAIAMGTDGLGLIAYRANGQLRVRHCEDPACATSTQTVVDSNLDQDGRVGGTSIAIGRDGFGIIAFHNEANGDLKVAHCRDVTCSSPTVTTVDSQGNAGASPSVVIGADGLPLIAYRYDPGSDLRVAYCLDESCSSATISTIDEESLVALGPSMAIANGRGVVAYLVEPPTSPPGIMQLRLAFCQDLACTAAVRKVPSAASAGAWETSIAIDPAGNPLVVYSGGVGANLRAYHCSDPGCTEGIDTQIDEGAGVRNSVVIGADGYGLIAYYDSASRDLWVAHCGNSECTRSSTKLVDGTGNVGDTNSITIDTKGLPLISYLERGSDGGDLKVAHCGDVTCGAP